MRILIVSRVDDEGALRYAKDLGTALSGSHTVLWEGSTARRLGLPGTGLGEAAADLAVVIGGTGRSSTPSRG